MADILDKESPVALPRQLQVILDMMLIKQHVIILQNKVTVSILDTVSVTALVLKFTNCVNQLYLLELLNWSIIWFIP